MSNIETRKTYGLIDNPINNKLISKLKENDENILLFPYISTEKIELTDKTKKLITNLVNFDWIIFTDVFAVAHFIEVLDKMEFDLFELDNLTVCAFGEVVADRLRFVQIHTDLIPTKIDNESIVKAISEFAADDLIDLRFLVLKDNSKELSITKYLIENKAVVEELAIYQAKFVNETANTKLKTLLKGGAVDEFVFSSAEDLVSLKKLLTEEDLALVLNESQISATAENVFQLLLENGLRPLYFHYK